MEIKQHASYFEGQQDSAERLREILNQTGFDLKFDFLVAVYSPNMNSCGSKKENVTTDAPTVLYSIWHSTDETNFSGIKPEIHIRELLEIPYYKAVHSRRINSDTIQYAMRLPVFDTDEDVVCMINIPYASYCENICHDYLEDLFTDEWSLVESKTFLACILENFLHETNFQFSEDRSARTYIFNLFEKCIDVQKENIVTHLNVISALAYEKQSNSGKILFVHPSTKLQLDIVFEKPISLRQRKKSRKLFEISTGDAYLVSDSDYIYGIITLEKLLKNCSNNDIILAEIYNPLSWELKRLNGEKWMSLIAFTGDRYYVNRTNNTESLLKTELDKVGIDASEYNFEKMKGIIEAASKQSHGTTIVFSKKAADEAKRLDSTSFKVTQTPLTAEVTKYITAIDGAVLCDFQGNCHAIGVILDGIELQEFRKKNALLKADISRGARYNSAVRYKCENADSIICIVSEDGGFKLI